MKSNKKEVLLKLIKEPFHQLEELTDRQREVLLLCCRGFRAPQIAEELGLSVRSATGRMTRMIKVINEAEDWDIKPQDLPDILWRLVIEELNK